MSPCFQKSSAAEASERVYRWEKTQSCPVCDLIICMPFKHFTTSASLQQSTQILVIHQCSMLFSCLYVRSLFLLFFLMCLFFHFFHIFMFICSISFFFLDVFIFSFVKYYVLGNLLYSMYCNALHFWRQ